MDKRTTRVVVETASHRITGDVTLPKEGYRSRLSDYLNQGDLKFISLTNVVIDSGPEGSGAPRSEHEFVAIGASKIVLAYPLP